MKKFSLVLVLLLSVCMSVFAAEKGKRPAEILAPDLIKASRQLNQKAPPIKVAKWLSGEKVNLYSSKTVQVLIFCEFSSELGKDLLPILNLLQEEYSKDVRMIALIPASEEASFAQLLPTLENPSVRLAVDKGDNSLKTYREAYGNFREIPYAFIIKKGKTLWAGHPLHKMDEALKEIVENRYNIEIAIRLDQARTLLEKYDEARLNGEYKYSKEVAQVMLRDLINDTDFLMEVATLALEHKDSELADAAISLAIRAARLDGDETQAKRLEKGLTSMRFASDLSKYLKAINRGIADAAVLGDHFLEKYKDETDLLLEAAPKVVFESENTKTQKFAEHLLDLVESKIGKDDFKTASLRAVLLYRSGKREEGARLFKKSMETLTDPEDRRLAEEMFKTLESTKEE